jgi:hypothetical protein
VSLPEIGKLADSASVIAVGVWAIVHAKSQEAKLAKREAGFEDAKAERKKHRTLRGFGIAMLLLGLFRLVFEVT